MHATTEGLIFTWVVGMLLVAGCYWAVAVLFTRPAFRDWSDLAWKFFGTMCWAGAFLTVILAAVGAAN